MEDPQTTCYKQKFGHNFPFPGSNCTKCGINQNDLSKEKPKKNIVDKYEIKKTEKGIHTEIHALAKDVSEYCGEPEKFAMYLGIIKNIGLKNAYQIFSEIKQNKKVKTPGKLFVYMSSYDQKLKKRSK